MDSTEFSADVCQSSLHTSSAHNITDLVKQYNTVPGELADNMPHDYSNRDGATTCPMVHR